MSSITRSRHIPSYCRPELTCCGSQYTADTERILLEFGFLSNEMMFDKQICARILYFGVNRTIISDHTLLFVGMEGFVASHEIEVQGSSSGTAIKSP